MVELTAENGPAFVKVSKLSKLHARSHQAYLKFRLKSLKDRPFDPKRGNPLIVGFFSAPTGLGQGVRLINQAFQDVGYSPACLDVTPYLQPNLKQIPIELENSKSDGPVILHVNPPELLNTLKFIGKSRLAGRRLIGVWAWEQRQLPSEWISRQHWLDEIWAISHFNYETFSKELTTPVCYMPYPTALLVESVKPVSPRHRNKPYRVFTAFDPASTRERKNPDGAVKAFQEAFTGQQDVTLTIKITERGGELDLPEAWRSDPRVFFNFETLSDTNHLKFISSFDVFMSLHRAEGYGFLIAKSLALGVPVISTNYSGNVDFMDCPHAYRVGFVDADVQNSMNGYSKNYGRWAEPKISDAIEHLRNLYAMQKIERDKQSNAAREWWQNHHNALRFTERLSVSSRKTFPNL